MDHEDLRKSSNEKQKRSNKNSKKEVIDELVRKAGDQRKQREEKRLE